MGKRKMLIEVTKAEADLINEGALSKAAETKWDKIGNFSTSDLVKELLKRRCGYLSFEKKNGTIVRKGSFKPEEGIEVQLIVTVQKGDEIDG